MGHFSGYFERAKTFLTPKLSLEMAQYVVCPQKKNNIPHFQNQRCINSYIFHQCCVAGAGGSIIKSSPGAETVIRI
jgi:hypothetical protein